MFELLTLHPNAFGLDISDLSLKFAELKRTRQSTHIAAWGEAALPEGVVVKGGIQKEEDLVALLKTSLRNVRGGKLSTAHVVASLPEEQAFLQVIQLPRMAPHEVQAAASFEAENYIPYPLETVYVDSEFVAPLKNHLDHTDILLASLPKATVDSYASVLSKAGLAVEALEVESLAVARALVPQEVSLVPLLLMDLGETRTSFLVFAGKTLRFTASIPVASRQLTLAVSKTLGVSFEKAEELKRSFGLERRGKSQGGQVFEALVPPMVDLVEQIKKYLEYYVSHAEHQHLPTQASTIQKIVLAGGGANLPGLVEFLESELNTKVVLGDPWANISSQPFGKLPPLAFADSLRYTTALGLALRGSALNYD